MSKRKLALTVIILVFSIPAILALHDYQVSGMAVHPKISGTMQIILIPYFPPTSYVWQTIYEEADKHPGTIKYVVINPCSGPCASPLSQGWEDVIYELRSRGIKTLGYLFNTSENFSNIDYYMKRPPVPTDGIFFDNEGNADNVKNFKTYADYVHHFGGLVYINPGYNYAYVKDYLTTGEADLANIYEVGFNNSNKIFPNKEFSPWKVSVIVGSIEDDEQMQDKLSEVAGRNFGITYLYDKSYGNLPNYFSDEISQAATTMVSNKK